MPKITFWPCAGDKAPPVELINELVESNPWPIQSKILHGLYIDDNQLGNTWLDSQTIPQSNLYYIAYFYLLSVECLLKSKTFLQNTSKKNNNIM